MTGKLRIVGVALLLALASAGAARAADRKQAFVAERGEIIVLAQERIRQAHADYQRTLKTAEDRLRALHDDYRVRGSTPPAPLDADMQELRFSTQKIRLLRARGRPVPANPEAERLIRKYWDDYQSGYDKLEKDILVNRRIGASESQTYWDVMKRYGDLRNRTASSLIYNAPAGVLSLEDVLRKNEWKLLKELESPNVKTRGKISCVAAPEEHPRSVNVDNAPFYESQGLLPSASPLESGAFFVPLACRTVVKRESGVKVILRVSRGKGIVYIGSTEHPLQYGYVMIPPDTAYYIENAGDDALDLEYITLPAS